MSPDDVETADNVARFVESTLSGDEPSAGALHPLASFGRWLLRATRADERGSVRIRAATARLFGRRSRGSNPRAQALPPPHSRSCSSSSSVDDRRSSARS